MFASSRNSNNVNLQQTHYHPRKKLLNRLQGLISSPKRVLGHVERDGIGVARERSSSTAGSGNASAAGLTANPRSPDDQDDPHEGLTRTNSVLETQHDVDHDIEDERVNGSRADANQGNHDIHHSSPAGDTQQQEVLLRPHLKVRIITW